MFTRLEAINLNLILALDVLLTELSVTRAARRLGITQSAMSHSLCALREMLDDPILVRTKNGMAPTEKAMRLAPQLHQCIQMLQQTLTAAADFDAQEAEGTFSIATGDFLMRRLGRSLSANFFKEAPRAELRLQALRGGHMHDALLSSEVDLVIGPELPREGGICSELVLSDPFVCAVRRGHPLLEGRCLSEPLTLEEFVAWPHLLISPNGRGEAPVDEALRAMGLRRHISVRVSSFLAAAEIVAATELILTAPLSCVETSGLDIAVLAAPVALAPLKLCAYWDLRRDRDPRLRWLLNKVTFALELKPAGESGLITPAHTLMRT